MIRKGLKVDLIYLDPPFNSNRTYSMIFNHRGITGQQKAYHDMWDFTDSTRQLVLDFRSELLSWDLPDSFKTFMDAWLSVLEQGTEKEKKLLNYLMYMTQRLIRMKTILNDTGSIYYHCDPTASHYIKVIMDGIFGRENFVNEVIWHYTTGGASKKHYSRKHDVLLFYSNAHNKHSFYPEKILFPRTDEVLRRIRSGTDGATRATTETKLPMDVWTDINALNPMSKERMGYPTQKPVELLNRIIQASSKEGDLVLDPFCGCGTTIEAANNLGRNWIGIDISGDAVDEIKDRMEKRANCYKDKDYKFIEGNPETIAEYKRLNPYDKQDWLVRKLGGLPNPKKSGDGGIDGEMTIHLGLDHDGSDRWGKLIFSVKTGKQKNLAHVRELLGTMIDNTEIGVLVLDTDPTDGMDKAANQAGTFKYHPNKNLPSKEYKKVQIITACEIIDGAQIDCPPTIREVKEHRKEQMEIKYK